MVVVVEVVLEVVVEVVVEERVAAQVCLTPTVTSARVRQAFGRWGTADWPEDACNVNLILLIEHL